MIRSTFAGVLIAFGLSLAVPLGAAAQDNTGTSSDAQKAGQEAKQAGKEAGEAAKDGAKATGKATKKAAKKTGHAAAGAAKSAGAETKSAANRVKRKISSSSKFTCNDGTEQTAKTKDAACASHGGAKD